MKKFLIAIFLSIATLGGLHAQSLTTPRGSQAASVTQTIGITDITISYHSPKVNDREIWGALVPYNEGKPFPWRAGANDNTTFTVTHEVKVEGKELPAGTYGLHMIPAADEWTIIFSNNSSSWGSFSYDQAEDALQIKVKPSEAGKHEWLTYEFIERGDNYAVVALIWEELKVPIRIDVDVHPIVLNSFKDQLRSTPGFTWQAWNQAATYCAQNDVDLEQGLEWAERSITGGFGSKETFQNLQTKSSLLAKLGRTQESEETMKLAIDHPTAGAGDLYGYGRQLIGDKKNKEAMDIFKTLAKKYPEHWLAEHGLARGYSANGDFKTALKYEEKALVKAPATSKQFLEGYVKTLKEGKDFN